MKLVPIAVRAYSGYKAEEAPRAFEHQGRVYEVSAVDSQALELWPDGRLMRRFEVKSGEERFRLAYDEREGSWFLMQ